VPAFGKALISSLRCMTTPERSCHQSRARFAAFWRTAELKPATMRTGDEREE
jgi:hypothetical protein